MDGLTIKPRDSSSRIAASRPGSARTALAPAQSVTAPSATANPQTGDDHPHDFHLAPDNQQVIDREREETERRQRRASDQALARMRAYGRAAAPAQDPVAEQQTIDEHADLRT
ncbi:MAG: hypothetical protein AB7K04_02210 [Pseudorhodoplanes sp.]